MQAYVDGEEIEHRTSGGWLSVKYPLWHWKRSLDYRVAKTQDSINWDHVAPEFICHARNEDGSVFLCSNKPKIGVGEWYNRGQSINIYYFTSFKRGTVDWEDSLVMRPGVED